MGWRSFFKRPFAVMIVTRPQPLYRLSPAKRPVPSEVRQCGVCRPHILSMPIRHPAYLHHIPKDLDTFGRL